MKIVILSVLCLISQAFAEHTEQWIDPHDMNTNAKQKLQKESYNAGDFTYTYEESKSELGENTSLVYLRRIVNLLVTSADFASSNLEHHGRLHFTVSDEDFEFLNGFSSKGNVNIEDLRRLDTILSKSLEKSYLDKVADQFLTAQERLIQIIANQNGLPLLGLLLSVYFVYNLIKLNFSTWHVVRYFIIIVALVDFMQRYQHLFKEAEEHNMHLKYSSKCDTNKMTWGEYFQFLTGNVDCEQKVVSLLEVALMQARTVIIVPLAAVGTGMGGFASGLWENLPFPWNILIFPIMLLFCVILAAVVMMTVNNTPFKFNIMHLLHLEFGGKKDTITGKHLDKLLAAVNHRPMLQEVKYVKYSSTPKKKAENRPQYVDDCKDRKEKTEKVKSEPRKEKNRQSVTQGNVQREGKEAKSTKPLNKSETAVDEAGNKGD